MWVFVVEWLCRVGIDLIEQLCDLRCAAKANECSGFKRYRAAMIRMVPQEAVRQLQRLGIQAPDGSRNLR